MQLRRFVSIVSCVSLLAISSLSARADESVTKLDGVSFQYTATDVNGVLTVSFENPFNFLTQVNSSLIPQVPAGFGQLTLSSTLLTDDIPGLSGHFTPDANTTQFGISSLSPAGAPNVVFNYSITHGSAVANGLTLTGNIQLAPGSATSYTSGGTTYDFSAFDTSSSFTLSLGTQDQTGVLIYNTLDTGNGLFNGSAQWDATSATQSVPDAGATASLLGFSLVCLAFLRRKLAC